jgi:hypothetical protein
MYSFLSPITTRILACASAIIAVLLVIGLVAPAKLRVERNLQLSDPELVDHGAVGYPLKGHIALTNVGKPVTGMLVECFVHGWKNRVAVTKTNSSGDFSFPDLPEGKYYVRASQKNVFTIRTILTTTRKSTNVLRLITEGCDRDCDNDPVLK